MSGRNHGPPLPTKPMPNSRHPQPMHEPAFVRGLGGQMSHPGLLEEMRESSFGMGGPRHLHHPAILEDHLAGQNHEIQALLSDNQGLAVVHVALRQELESAHFQLQKADQYANSLHPEKDLEMKEMRDKAVKLEMDVRGVEGMKAELAQVRADVKELKAAKEDLMGQTDVMTKDLCRYKADLEQVPGLKAEIDHLKQELQRARNAIEYEKKGYAQNFEHGQGMESKLLAMARELEKLRAEINNAEKRPAAAAGYSGATGYNANYGYTETGYSGNAYTMGYNMNQAHPAAESYLQGGPAPGAWGAYDMQRAQGHK
ncbi:hypothetical protein V2J09_009119 [Rumex salicifolius]